MSSSTALQTIPGATAPIVGGEPTACELSIIIVNWNSLGYVLPCIESIYRHLSAVSFEVIVVDNASPEGGLNRIGEAFPLVRVIPSTTNLGFAGANNLGFAYARGEYVLLLNPDTLVIGSALTLMLEQLHTAPDAGIVGCTLLNSDLSLSTTSIQAFPTILNQVLTAEKLRVMFPSCPLWKLAPLFRGNSTPVKVDVIPGACMMLRRDVFSRVGGLTEDYFMYGEDIDLNFKVAGLGLARYYVGAGQIVHHGGKSSTQKVNQWSTVMVQRAMWHLFRKRRGMAYAWAYRVAMGLAAIGRLALLACVLAISKRPAPRNSAAKWWTVLKWTVGAARV